MFYKKFFSRCLQKEKKLHENGADFVCDVWNVSVFLFLAVYVIFLGCQGSSYRISVPRPSRNVNVPLDFISYLTIQFSECRCVFFGECALFGFSFQNFKILKRKRVQTSGNVREYSIFDSTPSSEPQQIGRKKNSRE
jgi:hypothetical protein